MTFHKDDRWQRIGGDPETGEERVSDIDFTLGWAFMEPDPAVWLVYVMECQDGRIRARVLDRHGLWAAFWRAQFPRHKAFKRHEETRGQNKTVSYIIPLKWLCARGLVLSSVLYDPAKDAIVDSWRKAREGVDPTEVAN